MKRPLPILMLLLACAAPAAAQEVRGVERILLDRLLQERHVILTGLDDGHLSYIESGLVRTEPVSEYLAILPAPARQELRGSPAGIASAAPKRQEIEALTSSAVLRLVDNQRFAGAFRQSGDDPDTFVWLSPALGPLELRIDDASTLRIGAAGAQASLPRSDVADTVLLLNGDRLEGIIERFGDPMAISVGETEHALPLDRIAAVALANPPSEPSGMFVWLQDGTVVASRSMHTTRMGELQISPRLNPESESAQGRSASLPLEQVEAVNFDVQRLIPLAEIEPLEQRAIGDRRWSGQVQSLDARSSPLDAADLLLPGPMEVSWMLPESAARLALTAELPRESWTWGDCELIVEVRASGGQALQIARHRLNAEKPVGLINAEIPAGAGGVLVVRLEPGEYGPVQDRVILRRALLSAGPG